MRGTLYEETLHSKEAYERLLATHRERICNYRADNGRFADTMFKESLQICRQKIIYFRVGYHQQNTIVEHRIKELSLGSQNLLLRTTRLCPEAVSTMLRTFFFQEGWQSYNSLELDEDRKTPEQKISGMEFQNFPTDYHTWVCPVFVLEPPLQGGPEGLPKWKPRASTRVYIGYPPLQAGSVNLVLNIRTGHVSSHYHVVFDNKFSTVDHTRKVTVPVNWKNLVEDHSEIAMQENFTLEKEWNLKK